MVRPTAKVFIGFTIKIDDFRKDPEELVRVTNQALNWYETTLLGKALQGHTEANIVAIEMGYEEVPGA